MPEVKSAWWLKMLIPLVPVIWAAISPELKRVILESLATWKAKAKETSTPIDDWLVGIAEWLVSLGG
jgi:hypothetical protein